MKKPKMLLSRDDWYHARGYHVVAKALSNAGFEVVLGGIQTPKEIVRTAIQEDVDIIGCRLMDASPRVVMEILFKELDKHNIPNIPVVVGGIVSEKDELYIRGLGVREVFHPFDKLESLQERLMALV
ncbi:MAG: cobalamin-dependent protein [Desulfobacterales bacterium]